ncbi:hypothetical protein F8M41_001215 [Gigaspora margarita]|uniref:Uncharacterized protein n=1 Tax=Gigaspora margarita TaxID=4874 RepID=A0A8H4AA86_GIGMA|nr:hypothetical protein F8M41_001215 [Gigaspora margarita]
MPYKPSTSSQNLLILLASIVTMTSIIKLFTDVNVEQFGGRTFICRKYFRTGRVSRCFGCSRSRRGGGFMRGGRNESGFFGSSRRGRGRKRSSY